MNKTIPKGIIIPRKLQKEELHDNLIVYIKKNEIFHRIVYYSKHYNESTPYFEFIIADIETKETYPIVRSQWRFILENNHVFDTVEYVILEYTYDDTGESAVRAKLLIKGYKYSKPDTSFTISKDTIISILSVLSPRATQEQRNEMSHQLKTNYKLYGTQTSKRKRI